MVSFVLIVRLRGIVAWKTYTTDYHADTFSISSVKVDQFYNRVILILRTSVNKIEAMGVWKIAQT